MLFVAYDPAMTSPMDELLPVVQPTATAWILSGPASDASARVLGSFSLNLEPAGSTPPSALPPWMPPDWAANSSARALAALGLLEADPGMVHRLALGGQMLGLQRVEGPRS